ncbi:DUF6282 family protein [Maledivibacter halophilus]|uniref:Cytosolic protein n=1 Tax=Maledivibacter halophilus TaxID=36842 RepID=A0A1T5IBM7_9FIRM|nr:DUF6282 family protein [Maledivibacter halophilus]SKC36576.1 hypothetical protein SAMN02194393_00169 [Maledivibacter halophilus]
MTKDILNGAYDLHIHSAPDVMARKMNDLEMTKRAKAKGMKGFAIKSHFFCTSERASIVKEIYPDVNVIGTICLNNAVGGVNPTAVEMAARSGAKIVWMPTVDSENEQSRLRAGTLKKLPYWATIQQEMKKEGVLSHSIKVLENGELKQEVYEVLKVIAKNNMVLATSHLTHDETFAVVEAAAKLGVNRIIVTHVDFPTTFYTVEEQKKLVDFGAYMEHCFTTPATEKVAWDVVFDQIKKIGSKHCILATDLGQPTALYPDEGLEKFALTLLENGFNEKDIDNMIRVNPKYLVE